MNKLTKGLLGLAVVAVLVVVGVSFPTSIPGPKGDVGTGNPGKDGHTPVVKMVGDRLSVDGVLSQSLRGAPGAPGKDAVNLGAFPGPDMFSPYFSRNELTEFPQLVSWAKATSTVCSMLSPNATSTLNLSIQMTVATATDLQVSWGRGAGNEDYATTTFFNVSATTTPNIEFANNGTGIDDFTHSVVATTGVDVIDVNNKLYPGPATFSQIPVPPNVRVNVAVAAKNVDPAEAASDGYNLTGTCGYEFKAFGK